MNRKLIAYVREHELLYDRSHSDYKIQENRQLAWENIGSKLNIPAEDARKRWDKLRRCFNNARNRRFAKLSSSSDPKPTAPWKYEDEMGFILPQLELSKPRINKDWEYVTVEDQQQEETSEQNWLVGIAKTDESENEDYNNVKIVQVQSQNELEPIETKKAEEKVTRRKKVKQSKRIKEEQVSHQVEEKKQVNQIEETESKMDSDVCNLEKVHSIFENMDETDLFFLSMAKTMKRLPRSDQAVIKKSLSSMIFEAEFKNVATD